MSTSALMMIVREDDIPAFKFDSPQNVWKRLRSHSRGLILFRRLDADPEQVKRDIEKSLELARKTMFNFGFDAGQVSSYLISATVLVMPVQATWCPIQEGQIDQISTVFHYLLILDPVNKEWHLYWWKLEEEEFGQHTWTFQPDPRLGNLRDIIDSDFYDVVEKFIYRRLP